MVNEPESQFLRNWNRLASNSIHAAAYLNDNDEEDRRDRGDAGDGDRGGGGGGSHLEFHLLLLLLFTPETVFVTSPLLFSSRFLALLGE